MTINWGFNRLLSSYVRTMKVCPCLEASLTVIISMLTALSRSLMLDGLLHCLKSATDWHVRIGVRSRPLLVLNVGENS